MPRDLEYRLLKAVQAVREGSSQAKAARAWTVSRTTLKRRLDGTVNRKQAHEHEQLLSNDQERFVNRWIEVEELAGRAPTYRLIREFASFLVPPENRVNAFGRRWLRGFLRRNQNIRAKNAAGRVYGASLAKRPNKAEVKQTSDTTWATIIEAITAEGRKLTPTVIQTGNTLQAQWFPPNIEDWAYDSTPSRWSNAEIALRWLRQIYLPETKPENDSEWRLLLTSHSTSRRGSFRPCKDVLSSKYKILRFVRYQRA
ncbi:hypothetical protein OOU_Y34scaffold00031g1 [Pyricularia oryzae Y34]|uniref:HTH CENPB-type domain-containing protein n=1 Tax=Pyricularia oryzae (strain Y34) TaxID=1143189 RepID=A0AA97PS76_PYRO3|nr:hypothetical protein OOU_Y34scaffold00031g1 [Pyricularia oryzae Y34]